MDHGQPHGSIQRQCTATSKRSGKRCRKPAMQGRTVCLAHGGKTPRGIASPHFQHGRWSRDLPANLASRYEDALRDPELLSLRDEIALVDIRISTLLNQAAGDQDQPVDETTWHQVGVLIEQRRRLTESQVRHQVMAGQMLALDQAVILAAALAESVREHVRDPIARDAIQRDLEHLLGESEA